MKKVYYTGFELRLRHNDVRFVVRGGDGLDLSRLLDEWILLTDIDLGDIDLPDDFLGYCRNVLSDIDDEIGIVHEMTRIIFRN